MDGNRRWAVSKGLPRTEGHKYGAQSLIRAIEFCPFFNIRVLSVYALSAENLSRSRLEVNTLLKLAGDYLLRTYQLLPQLIKLHCTVVIRGAISLLTDPSIRRFAALLTLLFVYRAHPALIRDDGVNMDRLEQTSSQLFTSIASKMEIEPVDLDFFLATRIGPWMQHKMGRAEQDSYILNLCFCYSSTYETETAVRRIARIQSQVPEACHLDRGQLVDLALRTTPAGIILPPIDCIMRTGGEQRLSDFMLYETSANGASILSVRDRWPQVSTKDLMRIGLRTPKGTPVPSDCERELARYIASDMRRELIEVADFSK